jgi:LacI family transcriptional regulator
MPTLEDVARRAGVSTASVSRFLNTPDRVRQERRDRIESAVSALGYVPHGAARALASQRTQTIGAVIPTLDNAIFAKGVQAFQRRLHAEGYTLLLASFDYDQDEEVRNVDALLTRGVDALLLVGCSHAEKLYERLEKTGVPYVQTWTLDPGQAHPCVGFDNREAARRMASYLIDIGHREIALVIGLTEGNDRAAERAAGVRDALSERGLPLPPDRYLQKRYDVAEGRSAMGQLLDRPVPPTAVICGNDVLAMGALFECQARGVPVPEMMSITGFDDLPLSANLQPPLTTLHIPAAEMGRRAAEYLLARLGGEPMPRSTELEVGLLVRGTTAPPPVRK